MNNLRSVVTGHRMSLTSHPCILSVRALKASSVSTSHFLRLNNGPGLVSKLFVMSKRSKEGPVPNTPVISYCDVSQMNN